MGKKHTYVKIEEKTETVNVVFDSGKTNSWSLWVKDDSAFLSLSEEQMSDLLKAVEKIKAERDE